MMPEYLDEMEANAPVQEIKIGKPSGTPTGTTDQVSTGGTGGNQKVSGSTKTTTAPSDGVTEYQAERDRAIINRTLLRKAATKAERVAELDPLGVMNATAAREAVPVGIETSETQQFMPVQGEGQYAPFIMRPSTGYSTRKKPSFTEALASYNPFREYDTDILTPRGASEVFKSPGRYNPPNVPASFGARLPPETEITLTEAQAAAEAERPDPRSPEGLMIAAARVAAKQGQVNDSMAQAAERKSRVEKIIKERIKQDAYRRSAGLSAAGAIPQRSDLDRSPVGQIPLDTLTEELQKTDEYIARLNNLDSALGAIRGGTLRGVTPSDQAVAKQRAAIGQFETGFYEGTRPEEAEAAREEVEFAERRRDETRRAATPPNKDS
jgi:hypothetical protein